MADSQPSGLSDSATSRPFFARYILAFDYEHQKSTMTKERKTMQSYDLLVLGGGSAGFAAAIRAAEANKRVAMIEGGTMGGTCVNVGCVPSKTLIAAANTRHAALHARFQGLNLSGTAVDWSTVMGDKTALVEALRQAKYADVLAAYPQIDWVAGHGVIRTTDPVTVTVGTDTLVAPRLIVATGAHPWAPPIPGLADTPYWTSTEALASETLPETLLVIGGSAVGLEIGQLYQRLGSQVTVLEALDRIVPLEDTEVSEGLAQYLRTEGLGIHVGVQIQSVAHEDGHFTVQALSGGRAQTFTADRLLVATGRRPNTADFGLAEVGVAMDSRGAMVVNDRLQTSLPTIYAAGDVTGQAMFVYAAAEAGSVAATNALGLGDRILDVTTLPKVTFTDPQVASVGLTDAGTEAAGLDCTCTSLPLAYVPRALANRDTRGFIKLVVEHGTERIVGMHVVAPEAGEIIQVGTLAVKYAMSLSDVTSLFFPYLTMVEGVKLAAITFHKDVSTLSCCAGS